MKNFLAILLIFISAKTQAQEWAPKGMTWTYSFSDATFGPSSIPYMKWVVGDTITLKGKLCRTMYPEGAGINVKEMLSSMITYEDGGRVFWYSPLSDTFAVLYDFNKKVGESWMMYGIQDIYKKRDSVKCPLKVMVTAIGIDTINGVPLRSMQLKTEPSYKVFEGKVIEGIGHLVRPRPWSAQLRYCASVADISDDYFGLRCIDGGTIGFHDFKIVPNCEWKSTSINTFENQNPRIKISPNPSHGEFTITLSQSATQTINVMVFDLLGRLIQFSIQSLVNNETVVKLNCADGSYIVLLQNDQGLNSRQILVVDNQ